MSLIGYIAKIVEQLICSRLVAYLYEHFLLRLTNSNIQKATQPKSVYIE